MPFSLNISEIRTQEAPAVRERMNCSHSDKVSILHRTDRNKTLSRLLHIREGVTCWSNRICIIMCSNFTKKFSLQNISYFSKFSSPLCLVTTTRTHTHTHTHTHIHTRAHTYAQAHTHTKCITVLKAKFSTMFSRRTSSITEQTNKPTNYP